MKKKILSALCFLVLTSGLYSQTHTISGYITDGKTNETMMNNSVYESNSRKGTVSNTYGFYSLTLPEAEVDIQFSYVGYQTEQRRFFLSKDTMINIRLNEVTELSEITVTANRKETGVKGSQMSTIDVPISQIKTVPALFGETDVLKALQLLPGVQGGTEGSAGFYVRGGGPDENLFLLDGVPVYNVSHFGGMFSVFNADALKNVTLYKGNFPARFGGRLSSVVDIRMNDGNNKKLHGNFSVGLISTKFNLEGPLFSDKTTFNISGRRTYYDILAQPLLKMASAEEDMGKIKAGYYFYDLNAKISHKFSDKDRLYLSAYLGDDVIYGDIREGYHENNQGSYENRLKLGWDWGNLITALRWNHVISNKLFMNTTATYTRYRFDMLVGSEYESITKNPLSRTNETTTLGYRSGIEDIGAKVDFDYAINPNHDIKFGASYTHHTFRPGVQVFKQKLEENAQTQSMDTTIGNSNIAAHETTIYVEDNVSLGSFIKVNAGLHYSNFIVQDKFYHSLQPRLSLRALISDKLSFKAGYAAMNQNIHLLSNSTISLPFDLWVPVTKRIEPMKSHQYSAGFFYNLLNFVDLSIESYYKSMDNLLEYKDGSTFMGSNTGWEDKVSVGRGWSYGVEFLAQKTIGKTTGWLGYTWAKSERLFDRPGEELNNGEVFPAKYDRRHDVSLVVSHKFNKKIDVAGTWVYGTGNSGSLALQNYSAAAIDNNQGSYNYYNSIPHISKRNNYRLPDYMRLDVGVNFHKQKKYGIRTWNFSIYNATNQKNPFLVYAATEYDYAEATGQENERKVFKKLTIFTIIPSISYAYKF